MTDPEVLAFATRRGWTVLTLNRRHFVRLHEQHPKHSGIIVCTFDANFTRQAERIHAELQKAASLDSTLLRVNRPS